MSKIAGNYFTATEHKEVADLDFETNVSEDFASIPETVDKMGTVAIDGESNVYDIYSYT